MQKFPVTSHPGHPVPSRGLSGREFSVPKFFGTRQNRDGTKMSSGQDGTWDGVVPCLSRPEGIYYIKKYLFKILSHSLSSLNLSVSEIYSHSCAKISLSLSLKPSSSASSSSLRWLLLSCCLHFPFLPCRSQIYIFLVKNRSEIAHEDVWFSC